MLEQNSLYRTHRLYDLKDAMREPHEGTSAFSFMGAPQQLRSASYNKSECLKGTSVCSKKDTASGLFACREHAKLDV